MELFGIIFSVPVAFVLSKFYCDFLANVVRSLGRVRLFLYNFSLIFLCLFLVELLLLVTLGAVRSRAIVGPGFSVADLLFFLLGTPALANVLILGERRSLVGKRYLAVTICTIFSFFRVLLQYAVSEALYGIDGTNIP